MQQPSYCTQKRHAQSLFEEVRINFDEIPPLFRSCRLLKNGCNGTGGLASTAIYTLIRVDIKLLSLIKAFLILRRVDAVNRADIDARCIFDANARLSNHIRHCLYILLLAHLLKVSGGKVICSGQIQYRALSRQCQFLRGTIFRKKYIMQEY